MGYGKIGKKVLVFVLYSILVLVITLGTLEFLLRAKILKNDTAEALTQARWRDVGYIYTHFPYDTINVKDERGESILVKTDRFGLRNEDSIYDGQVKHKILVLGDSFTEASATPHEYTLVSRLNEFAKNNGYDVSFINGGLDGYGNWQSFLLLDSVYQKKKPDVVILMACLGNDLRDNYLMTKPVAGTMQNVVQRDKNETVHILNNPKEKVVMRRRAKAFIRNNIVGKSYILKILYAYIAAFGQQAKPEIAYDYFRTESYKNIPRQFVLDAGKKTDFIFHSFKEYCDKRGIRLIVFLIPSKIEVFDEIFFTTPEQKRLVLDLIKDPNGYDVKNPIKYFKTAAENNGVTFVDMTPFFEEHSKEKVFGVVDFHWSRLGQALAASFVFDALVKDKYLEKN